MFTEEQLQIIIAACAEEQLSGGEPLGQGRFNIILSKARQLHLASGDRRQVEAIGDLGQQGLICSRKRLILPAHEAFISALRCRSRLPAGGIGRLFADSALFPQLAYFRHAHGQHDRAIRLLTHAFQSDVTLEEHGVNILIIHRIQLVNNLARTMVKRGEHRKALLLNYAAMTLLECGRPSAMEGFPKPWNSGWWDVRELQEPTLLAAMHNQIAKEYMNIYHSKSDTEDFWSDILGASHAPKSAEDSQAAMWGRLKADLSKGREREAIATAVVLLQRGAMPSHALWRSTAMEMASMISRRLTEA